MMDRNSFWGNGGSKLAKRVKYKLLNCGEVRVAKSQKNNTFLQLQIVLNNFFSNFLFYF